MRYKYQSLHGVLQGAHLIQLSTWAAVTPDRKHVSRAQQAQNMDLATELPDVRGKQGGRRGIEFQGHSILHSSWVGRPFWILTAVRVFAINPELINIVNNISATLRDEILVASATKVPKKAEQWGRHIPISMTRIEGVTLDDTLIEGNVDGENADTYHKVDY